MRFLDPVKRNVHPVCKGADLLELCYVGANPAADIEHALPSERAVFEYQSQPAVLAEAPDVAGMSKRDGGLICHGVDYKTQKAGAK